MIICRRCGHANPDGATFCARCEGFLEWTGESVGQTPSGSEPERGGTEGPGPGTGAAAESNAGGDSSPSDRDGAGDREEPTGVLPRLSVPPAPGPAADVAPGRPSADVGGQVARGVPAGAPLAAGPSVGPPPPAPRPAAPADPLDRSAPPAPPPPAGPVVPAQPFDQPAARVPVHGPVTPGRPADAGGASGTAAAVPADSPARSRAAALFAPLQRAAATSPARPVGPGSGSAPGRPGVQETAPGAGPSGGGKAVSQVSSVPGASPTGVASTRPEPGGGSSDAHTDAADTLGVHAEATGGTGAVSEDRTGVAPARSSGTAVLEPAPAATAGVGAASGAAATAEAVVTKAVGGGGDAAPRPGSEGGPGRATDTGRVAGVPAEDAAGVGSIGASEERAIAPVRAGGPDEAGPRSGVPAPPTSSRPTPGEGEQAATGARGERPGGRRPVVRGDTASEGAPADASPVASASSPGTAPAADATGSAIAVAAAAGGAVAAGVTGPRKPAATGVGSVGEGSGRAGDATAATAGQPGEEAAAAGSAPAARQPAAMQPARRERRVVREERTAAPLVGPGEAACRTCGIGNPPGRHFCRRCGRELVDEQASAVRLPWWRRLWAWLRRLWHRLWHGEPEDVPAGERPGRWRRTAGGAQRVPLVSPSRLKGLVAIAVAALVVLSLVGPFHRPLQSAYHRVTSAFSSRLHPTLVPVIPAAASASSYVAGHPPSSAIDLLTDTYWATAPAKNNGVGQTLTVYFAGPQTIDQINMLIGDTAAPQDFLTEPRPAVVDIAFSDGVRLHLDLVDETKFQDFPVHATHVTQVTLTIVSVYPSLDNVGHSCSLAEMDFFTLQ